MPSTTNYMTQLPPTLGDIIMTNRLQFNSQAPDLMCMVIFPNMEKNINL